MLKMNGKNRKYVDFFFPLKGLLLQCFYKKEIIPTMAKKKQAKPDSMESVESALSRTELFLEENQKIIVRIIAVIVALVAIFIGIKRFYLGPLQEEAQAQMFVAEQYFEADSFNLALYGDGNYSGFLDIIDEYGITKSANLSKYYAGISFLKMGQYEDALEYLKKFKSEDKMVAPIATGAIADALVELDEVEEAVKYYLEAARLSDNQFTTPLYLMKAGLVCEQLEDYEKAADLYEQIDREYPDFSRQRNIEKYIARTKLLGGL